MVKLAHHRKKERMPTGEQVTWGHWSTLTTDVVRTSFRARSLGCSVCHPTSWGQVAEGVVLVVMGLQGMVMAQWFQRLSVIVCLVLSNMIQMLDQIVSYRFWVATGGLKHTQGLVVEGNQAEQFWGLWWMGQLLFSIYLFSGRYFIQPFHNSFASPLYRLFMMTAEHIQAISI